jgi:hypothetical protein
MLVALVFLCVAAFAAAAFLHHPVWALVGYYLVGFMRPTELHVNLYGQSFSLPLVAAALGSSVLWVVRKGRPRVTNRQVTLTVIMVAHMGIGGWLLADGWSFGHSRPLDAVSHWRKFDIYWKMALVLVIASKVLTEPRWIHVAAGSFAFSAGFLGLWANWQYFRTGMAPVTGPGPHIGIYDGLFIDRNDFGMLLSMGIASSWYMAQQARPWLLKAAWLGTIPFLLHAILLTESRGAILGAAAAFGYITWRSKRRVLMGTAMVVGMAFSLVFFASDRLLARYGTISNYQQDSSALSRMNTWQVGWRMMWGNPLLGVGLDNYTEVFYDYSDWTPKWVFVEHEGWQIVRDFDFEVHRAFQAHNMWLQRGGESGLLGCLMLLAFIVIIAVDTEWNRRRIQAIRAGPRAPPVGSEDFEALRTAEQTNLMIQGVMLPYLATGFFLSMEDFEALYLFGMLAGALTVWLRKWAPGEVAAVEEAQPPPVSPSGRVLADWLKEQPPPRPT